MSRSRPARSVVSSPLTRMRDELRTAREGGGPGADDAEIALAEGPIRQRLRAAIRGLADHRGPKSSICPSDAARAIGGDNWRSLMDDTRDLARELARSGHVQIAQRGNALDPDGAWSGPIRIKTAHR